MMAGYRLYGRPGNGNMVVEAAFAEAGIAYQLVTVQKDAEGRFDPAFLALNPRGQVPLLLLPDGSAMTETAAILLHLADAFPAAGLAPKPGSSARAQHDRWLTFFHANVYEAILRYHYPNRYVTDPAAAEAVKQAADTFILQHFAMYDAALGAGPYHFGDNPTMLDLMVWMLAGWCNQNDLAERCPKVARQSAAIAARPAIGPVALRNP